MICYTHKKLENYIVNIPNIKTYKKRFCYNELKNLAIKTNDMRVVALYGLRRTGKSILMAQLVLELHQYSNICWIKCHKGDDMSDLRKIIEEHAHCKYFFIDEITRLENFSKEASDLSDIYSAGHRIIMAGTDSLGFYISKQDELYDRIHMIHTTYIPYKEYTYLLNKGLDDYIMYGGTLTDGNDFYNEEKTLAYSNTAIAENIQHSLDDLGRNGEYGILAVFRQKGELTTFFNKIIELYNRQFTKEIVNNKFKTHDILALKQYNRHNKDADYEQLNTKINSAFRKELMKSLDIIEPLSEKATERAIHEAKKYLQALDVIYPIPNTAEVIFTQPGLRYSQCSAQSETILKSENISFTDEQRMNLKTTLDNDIKGRMLEDIIYYQLAKDELFAKRYEINKFSSPLLFGEFDLTLISRKTNEAYLIEVKHSSKIIEQQARHLNNLELCNEFEYSENTKIIAKIVIYMGNTLSEEQFGVNYINAEDFLQEPEKLLEHVHRLSQIPPAINETFEKGTPEEIFVNIYNDSYNEYNSHDIAALTAAKSLYKNGFDRVTVISTVDELAPMAAKDKFFTSRIIHKLEKIPAIQKIIENEKKKNSHKSTSNLKKRLPLH